MPKCPADRLILINHQAIAILRLGIPLDFGLGSDTVTSLQEINHRLATNAGSDATADQLLSKYDFPARYKSIAAMLLSSDDPAPIFESIYVQKHDRELATNPIRQALVEPLVIACLVYFGLILLCSNTVDTLQSQLDQMGQRPTGATAVMIAVRDAMPYWVIAAPIILIALMYLWNKFLKQNAFRLLPRNRAYGKWLAAESQTRRLAAMVDSGVDVDQALSLASSSVKPHLPIRPMAEKLARKGTEDSDSESLSRLASLYGFLARDLRQTVLTQTPVLIGIALAAIFVFAFAMATFVPWVELLNGIAAARGS